MHQDHFKEERDKEIDSAFLDLTRQLIAVDFSKSSNKETVYMKTLKNLNESEGVNNMKLVQKVKKAGLAVAAIALVTTLSMQTTFAQELVEKIIMQISLGHVTAIQYEDSGVKESPVPPSLKGKIFDKEGKPIDYFTEETKDIYTVDGERIESAKPSGEIVTVTQGEKSRAEDTLVIKDSERLNDYTCFKVILPSYLPEGYVFDRAEFYKDEKGIVKDTKYISLYFSHLTAERYIYMQQRYADEGTATIGSTPGNLKKIKINGEDAILHGDRSLDWEIYGNIYFLSGAKTEGEVGKEELIKIAESIK
ncbi:DUF4367 domain-containing protein [Cellulosilyticum sp. I15G10I2]|uniref:DUF4367 domain-containing protein n=1 Tax=Cellulosilyticum sp. I15G10I2 TaxID=1892843 RepID=UPI00085C877F|nr:DUF4367 domain-containing protein [Cellulosilyticum sp. I15G10I2]